MAEYKENDERSVATYTVPWSDAPITRSLSGDNRDDFSISHYETQGLDATLAHYNGEQSIDGQWYVFIVDENDLVIGHPDAHRLGLDLKGWVGTDANGYNFGPDMLPATEESKWVSYVYENPESGGIGADHTGALEYKHV